MTKLLLLPLLTEEVEEVSRAGAAVHFVGELERGMRVGKQVRQTPSGEEQLAQEGSQAEKEMNSGQC